VTGATDRVMPGLRNPASSDRLAGVLIFLLLGVYPMVLLLTWGIAIYLTWIETREQEMDWRHKLWWIQLTFLTHFLGYIALRFWVFYRRHRVTA
jgi:hypothetical protein